MHRLLKRLLLESPRVLSASEFVPPLGLRNPFSPVSGFRPRPLQAIQFHHRALVVTHKLSSLGHNLFLLLRQSHYDYATELSLDLLVSGPALDSMSARAWSIGQKGRHRIPAITPETAKTILALGRRKCFGKCPLRGGHLKLMAFSSYLPGQFERCAAGLTDVATIEKHPARHVDLARASRRRL